MVHGVEGEAIQSTLESELDVIGADSLLYKLPNPLHDVVPALGKLQWQYGFAVKSTFS